MRLARLVLALVLVLPAVVCPATLFFPVAPGSPGGFALSGSPLGAGPLAAPSAGVGAASSAGVGAASSAGVGAASSAGVGAASSAGVASTSFPGAAEASRAGASGSTADPDSPAGSSTTPSALVSIDPLAVESPFPMSIAARAAIVVDAATGQVLTEWNADEAVPLASVTKIMTLLLTFEAIRDGAINLDQVVTVSDNVQTHLPWNSSRMYLEGGDQITVAGLIYGAAVASGNDACIALAELIDGAEETFIARMNQKAVDLGLTTAHFDDAHGYSPESRMSARDLATLCCVYLREFPEALAYHSAESETWNDITQYNHNPLLWTYDGCDGLKTGYTYEAGYNLVATATRGGYRLLAAVLGVPFVVAGQWGDNYRDDVAASLLDWGFATYTRVDPLSGADLVALPVYKGAAPCVGVAPMAPVTLSVPRSLTAEVDVTLEYDETYDVAPVPDGKPVGTAVVMVEGREVARLPLATASDVARGGLLRVAWDTLRLAFRPVR